MIARCLLLLALAGLCGGCRNIARDADRDLTAVRLPAGFRLSLFADGVPGARSLALSPQGTLFIGTREAGSLYAAPDKDGDGRADRVVTLARGLDRPNGVALRGGALYVAENARVLRYDAIEDHLDAPPEPVEVSAAFPADRSHGWKFIRFGPDGLLYVPVGAPCNICDPEDPRYASILRLRPDGGGLEVFARGIRNTVGFDWHPETGQLWFTENGRDEMGDDVPPDELNRAEGPGKHFGYPYCHGGDTLDPAHGQGKSCADYVSPMAKLGPHVAALGMRFYRGAMFPKEYQGQVFIAEHGSWNRSEPIGYRVTLVRLAEGRAVSYEPFADFLRDGRSFARPVDVEVAPDGALLISDDRGGAVYRVTYEAAASHSMK